MNLLFIVQHIFMTSYAILCLKLIISLFCQQFLILSWFYWGFFFFSLLCASCIYSSKWGCVHLMQVTFNLFYSFMKPVRFCGHPGHLYFGHVVVVLYFIFPPSIFYFGWLCIFLKYAALHISGINKLLGDTLQSRKASNHPFLIELPYLILKMS